MERQIIFLDTETTGFGSSARVVQMAWLVHDLSGNEIKSENHVIKPIGFEIPEEATKIHGITTQEAIDGGEDLEGIISLFLGDIVNSDLLVGHNISFDIRMMTYEIARLGLNYQFSWIEKVCTMHKSTDYCAIPSERRYYKKPKLQELHSKLFGDKFEGEHDASADIQATARCYYKLKELGVIDPIIL